jgi:hypothetical protein
MLSAINKSTTKNVLASRSHPNLTTIYYDRTNFYLLCPGKSSVPLMLECAWNCDISKLGSGCQQHSNNRSDLGFIYYEYIYIYIYIYDRESLQLFALVTLVISTLRLFDCFDFMISSGQIEHYD